MLELEFFSQITLNVLLILFSFVTLLLAYWQFNVFKGKSMNNPDGSVDDWHEQKILFGLSFSDLIIICPITIISIGLILINSPSGFYILGLVSFWYVWVNTAFTVTSLRFEEPRINLTWFIVYPFGIILGLTYLIWLIIHFNEIILS